MNFIVTKYFTIIKLNEFLVQQRLNDTSSRKAYTRSQGGFKNTMSIL